MRIDRERLAFHALCVLAQANENARAGRVPPNPSLRLALAVIAKLGASSGLIDTLWHELTQRVECGDAPGAIGRRQVLNAGFNGAVRAVGLADKDRLVEAVTRTVRRAGNHEAPAPD